MRWLPMMCQTNRLTCLCQWPTESLVLFVKIGVTHLPPYRSVAIFHHIEYNIIQTISIRKNKTFLIQEWHSSICVLWGTKKTGMYCFCCMIRAAVRCSVVWLTLTWHHNASYILLGKREQIQGSPGNCNKRIRPYAEYGATVLQESHKVRVRVWWSYRSPKSSGYKRSGYVYGSLDKNLEVEGIVAQA